LLLQDRPGELKFHVLLTTYDDLIRDFEELAEVPWRSVVVDEAHRLRNLNSRLLESLRAIMQKGTAKHGFQHRILMTGTPLQNNMDELWSLMNFIEPEKFGDRGRFLEKYGAMETEEQVLYTILYTLCIQSVNSICICIVCIVILHYI
jgi:chromodomain-helicase-DNA-binding protein 7